MSRKEIEDELEQLRSENKQLKSHESFIRLHISFLRLKPPFVSSISNICAASFPAGATDIFFLQSMISDSGSDSDPDNSVPVNRFVLVSRSPIFKEMLDIDEGPNASNKVLKIPDASPQVLRSFVNFLYNGEITRNEDIALSLLILGDKYKVEHLKTCCELYLFSKVNAENVTSWLEFAAQYNAKKLRSACLDKLFEVQLLQSNILAQLGGHSVNDDFF